jgi:hypothetical protein
MASAVYASLHQHLYKLLRRYHLDSHFSLSARFSDGSLCLLVDTFFSQFVRREDDFQRFMLFWQVPQLKLVSFATQTDLNHLFEI